MKRFFSIFMLFCLLIAVPAYAESEIILADAPVNATTTIKYTTTNVNIRKEPSLEAEIITTVLINTEINKIKDYDDTWSEILWEDKNNYYIASEYLSDSKITIDPDKRYWLAHAINGEMEGASWEDHLYTGSVILNRVKSPHYPNAIIDVIVDRRWGIQYMCYWDGNFKKEPKQMAWDAADYLLTHGSQLPDNVLFQAEFKQGNGVYLRTNAAYYCIW
ncbi:MAG: cell wall hydrolase [Bacillota bacterium]|nr:cell wall hydrolase [Bacillota bacterium]